MALNDGLLGMWEDYATGGDWLAARGGLNLTLTGSVAAIAGKVGDTVPQFDGTSGNYFTSASLAIPSTFMIACWAWLDDISTHRMIAAKDDATSNREFTLSYNSAAGALEMLCMGGGFDSAQTVYSTTGEWFFLVGWRDAVNSQVGVRFNNGTKHTANLTTTPTPGSEAFAVGDRPASPMPMDGKIGPLAVWSRLLSDVEQDQLWNGGTGIRFDGRGPISGVFNVSPVVTGTFTVSRG